jgi:hypothetical protein
MNWQDKIKELDNTLYGSVDLICDGYNVTFQKHLYTPNQFRYMFYINGTWSGEYASEDSEIGAKFGAPRYFRPKKKEVEFAGKIAKIKGFKFNADKYIKEHTKIVGYHPAHASTASIIRRLKMTCKSIEVRITGFSYPQAGDFNHKTTI